MPPEEKGKKSVSRPVQIAGTALFPPPLPMGGMKCWSLSLSGCEKRWGGANSREMRDENRGKRKKGLGCFSIVVGFKISTDIRWWGVSE